MAGGLGKRMNSDIPKVLHMVQQEPMVVHVIRQALLLSPDKIIVVVGKYRNIIIETIAKYCDIGKLVFVDQPEPLGTGHAIQCCHKELILSLHQNICQNIHRHIYPNVVILSGDVPMITADAIRELLAEKNDKLACLITTDLDQTSVTGYGRIVTDHNGQFAKIVEEKDCTTEELQITVVNCGIYIIDIEIILRICIDNPDFPPMFVYINPVTLTNANENGEYYLTDVIGYLSKYNEKCNVGMYKIPITRQHEILGINTPEQLIDVDNIWLSSLH